MRRCDKYLQFAKFFPGKIFLNAGEKANVRRAGRLRKWESEKNRNISTTPPNFVKNSRVTANLSIPEARAELANLLRQKSIFRGEFTLRSGAKSNYYIDCRLTTLDPRGAWLVGQLMCDLIRREQAARGVKIDAVGGLTMGADPVALATGMSSHLAKDEPSLQVFTVRKAPKDHGTTKLVEGNFKKGDTVVVIDDVVTRGESTITAINAIKNEGGNVAFAAVLVDRQEGGRKKIEDLGHPVVALFTKDELLA
jgi:orotate phosphoribosyltransferase